MTISEDKFEFVPVEEAIIPPPGLIDHMKDRWWIVHPDKGLAFFKSRGSLSPQCNGDERITRRLSEAYPWAEVRFIPSAFRRINPNDYVM